MAGRLVDDRSLTLPDHKAAEILFGLKEQAAVTRHDSALSLRPQAGLNAPSTRDGVVDPQHNNRADHGDDHTVEVKAGDTGSAEHVE